uniref:small monomeric GTPase n=1 Tax=Oncorhynchus tshawytscha TaxID=74940 RepID=A0AAZ3PY34_ONCTS
MRGMMATQGSPVKSYDYLLKFLLVGDSDVGKGEILDSLQDGSAESPYPYSSGIDYKTTTILLDGRRVKLELWDTSGQGRFCTIFRSYSRGAQGILLVYDITNGWSFDGIDRWIREIDEHAPGVPRILVGNRLHLAFKRQVPTEQARAYAEKNGMTFFEVSPLCNFNVIESFTELSRIVLMRHGMEKFWRPNRGVMVGFEFIIEGMSVTPRPLLWRVIDLEVEGPSWSGAVCHRIIGLSLLSLQAISTLCVTGKTSSSFMWYPSCRLILT